jgi:glutaredoxin-like protein NrdH
MVRVYGVKGCGPCEVSQMYLRQKGIPFEFVDVARDEGARQMLRERLPSLTSGVILEHDDRFEVMQGVSVASLNRWYHAYRSTQRHGSQARPNE